MKWVDRLANIVKDSLWQANCPLCKRPADRILCKDCDRQIVACQAPEFLQLDHPISTEIPLYSWGVYDGALKRAIAACKYDSHPEIMEAIGAMIGDTWTRLPDAKALTRTYSKISIIPIPLHANKLKSRGFNQAEVLARRFGESTNLPCTPQLLQRVKETKAQMQTKSTKEREENLAKAFMVPLDRHVSRDVSRNVLLFDDIFTTGATIREAIATLADSKIMVRGVIVLARPKFTSQKSTNQKSTNQKG